MNLENFIICAEILDNEMEVRPRLAAQRELCVCVCVPWMLNYNYSWLPRLP